MSDEQNSRAIRAAAGHAPGTEFPGTAQRSILSTIWAHSLKIQHTQPVEHEEWTDGPIGVGRRTASWEIEHLDRTQPNGSRQPDKERAPSQGSAASRPGYHQKGP